MYRDYKKAGIIHKIINKSINDNLNNFSSSMDIVLFIENEIKRYTKYDENNPLNAGIAFPVGISINEIVAHDTPYNFDIIFSDNDLIKIDYGIHINGCISDGAFSYCKSGKYNELIDISKKATEIGIKNSGPDCILGEIGESIQEYIESKEINIDQKIYKLKSIYDICGHNMAPYIIHLNKAVPNIKLNYRERMSEDEVFAIETFPTIGNGKIYECNNCNHFMIHYKNDINSIEGNKFLENIYENRKTLAFCQRWFDFEIPDNKIITKFPVLKTCDSSVVSQYEKTIYIKNNGVEILN